MSEQAEIKIQKCINDAIDRAFAEGQKLAIEIILSWGKLHAGEGFEANAAAHRLVGIIQKFKDEGGKVDL